MSVTLTDEQYGRIIHTVRKIACGTRQSRRSPDRLDRITRDEQMTMARELSDEFGWDYSVKNVMKQE